MTFTDTVPTIRERPSGELKQAFRATIAAPNFTRTEIARDILDSLHSSIVKVWLANINQWDGGSDLVTAVDLHIALACENAGHHPQSSDGWHGIEDLHHAAVAFASIL